ncbi:hypothetical protein [Dyella sp. Tek66A03]|uniref:hypothetical protein n=1 Tax=Dyella sp. Tek66A03 TaxID=3458298 RepID=UPI00403E85F9
MLEVVLAAMGAVATRELPRKGKCSNARRVGCVDGCRGGSWRASWYRCVVAPPNATVFLGNGDAVNGFYGGQLFNWNATVVPIKFITGHPYENYKPYVDGAAKDK